MNVFGKRFKKTAKRTLDDPAFGRIEFSPSHGMDMWCHVPSESSDQMVLVVAPSSGPTQAQRDFYSTLRTVLASREAECKAFIAHQGAPLANISRMGIYSVEVGPEDETAKGEFVIELSEPEANEIHRVEFAGGRPVAYGVDD